MLINRRLLIGGAWNFSEMPSATRDRLLLNFPYILRVPSDCEIGCKNHNKCFRISFLQGPWNLLPCNIAINPNYIIQFYNFINYYYSFNIYGLYGLYYKIFRLSGLIFIKIYNPVDYCGTFRPLSTVITGPSGLLRTVIIRFSGLLHTTVIGLLSL